MTMKKQTLEDVPPIVKKNGDFPASHVTLPTTNSKFAPENRPKPKRPKKERIESSNHPFVKVRKCC